LARETEIRGKKKEKPLRKPIVFLYSDEKRLPKHRKKASIGEEEKRKNLSVASSRRSRPALKANWHRDREDT